MLKAPKPEVGRLEVALRRCFISSLLICMMGLSGAALAEKEGEIKDVAEGKRDIKKLFSDKQERFLADQLGGEENWKKLRGQLKALGPVAAEVWKPQTPGFTPGLTAELWTVPKGASNGKQM